MERNILDEFDMPDILKAFFVSMIRMTVENPEVLLIINENSKVSGWKELYDELTDPQKMELMSQRMSDSANQYNWEKIEETYGFIPIKMEYLPKDTGFLEGVFGEDIQGINLFYGIGDKAKIIYIIIYTTR